jgi:hypothetical protein
VSTNMLGNDFCSCSTRIVHQASRCKYMTYPMSSAVPKRKKVVKSTPKLVKAAIKLGKKMNPPVKKKPKPKLTPHIIT